MVTRSLPGSRLNERNPQTKEDKGDGEPDLVPIDLIRSTIVVGEHPHNRTEVTEEGLAEVVEVKLDRSTIRLRRTMAGDNNRPDSTRAEDSEAAREEASLRVEEVEGEEDEVDSAVDRGVDSEEGETIAVSRI